MDKKIVNLYDLMAEEPDKKGFRLLTEEQGCVKGCCAGISTYGDTEYGKGGVHDDQEGFFVLSGHGMVKLGEEEYPIKAGSAFMAPAGVFHTMKRDADSEPVQVFWFHSAI